jgi:hypothetical protein
LFITTVLALASISYVGIAELVPSLGAELVFMGPTFMHYVLDTKIWRTRNDPELAQALGIA